MVNTQKFLLLQLRKQTVMRLKHLLQLLMVPLMLFGTLIVNAQGKSVSGKVTDAKDGSPLAGVSVMVKGARGGTATGADGTFTLTVNANATTLVFSSIGYTAKEVAITDGAMNVSLEANATQLSDVVVVGYGTSRRKDVTGAVARISEKDFNQGAVTNPLQQIAGRAAGVNITVVGNEPGVAPNIRIRGITSLIGGSDPLVVVDGIQGGLDLLQQIPPSEIESFDILKDASATAIYGSRGAAGVVLVTTKKGKAGKSFVEYNGTVAFEAVAKQYEVLNAAEWRAEAAKRGIAASADYGGNTDWFKELTRNGLTHTHNLAFGGGTSSLTYRASVTAINQTGIVLNSGYKNYIARFQATQKALDNKLTLTMNASTNVEQNEWNGPGVIQASYTRRPTDPIYNADGSYFIDPLSFGYTNPYARAKEIIDGRERNGLFASLRADLEIIKGLNLAWFGSWRKNSDFSGFYAGRATTIEDARNQKGLASKNTNQSNEKLTNLSLVYRKSVGRHSFDVTGVYEWQQGVYDGFSAQGRGFVNDFNSFNALQSSDFSSARPGDVSSYKSDQTLVSFLGRINYAFANRYNATLSFRRDGSSKFGANNKWANFPSASVAWKISEEDFLKGNKYINDLKLRAGFGITGNQQGLGPLNSVRLVGPAGTTFFGGAVIPNYAITQNANPDLRWETRQMFNVGLDFAILNNRLSGTIEYFNGDTKDLLFGYGVPTPPFPYNSILANVGTINNQGIELSLNYKAYTSRDWDVVLAGNFTANRTKVTSLSGQLNGVDLKSDTVRWGNGGTTGVASTNDGISYLITGQPLGSFFLFKNAGVDAYGNQIITDINKNGNIDQGDLSGDRYIAGQVLPKFTYAFTPTVRYKDLDVAFVFRGAGGHHIYNARRAQLSALGNLGQTNVLKTAPGIGINNVEYASDLWLEKGDFFRLDNLTAGYRFKTGSIKYVESMRLSVTATNLFVISGYEGMDPELRQDGGAGTGIDFGIFPRTRTIAVGLQVNFK